MSFLLNKRILMTGGSGFLGSRIVNFLNEKNISEILIPRSKDCDLTIRSNCDKVTKDVDVVFHIAAKVGGIGFNLENPGELFYDNIMMGTNLMDSARVNNITKFIALGTICSYPKFTPLPFDENSIWNGYPEETNAPYGLAKKMLLVQSQSYKKQYNFNSISIFPTNLYGPRDNFNENTSHVIPAIIRKITSAIVKDEKTISLWGDGTPTRDFLYVDDAAQGIILAAEKYNSSKPLNLGSGEEISIKLLAEKIMKLMNTDLEIIWETDKPNGQPRRCVSIEKARKEISFEPKITLDEGLQKTIDWYRSSIL